MTRIRSDVICHMCLYRKLQQSAQVLHQAAEPPSFIDVVTPCELLVPQLKAACETQYPTWLLLLLLCVTVTCRHATMQPADSVPFHRSWGPDMLKHLFLSGCKWSTHMYALLYF